MNKVKFTIEGEIIVDVVNETKMSDDFVRRLIRVFIDLGWIITEVKTEGFFELKEKDSVHIEYKLTENDGTVEPYTIDEDTFIDLLTEDEPVETKKKIGFVGMSNVSQA